jgi:hypothetical protein
MVGVEKEGPGPRGRGLSVNLELTTNSTNMAVLQKTAKLTTHLLCEYIESTS